MRERIKSWLWPSGAAVRQKYFNGLGAAMHSGNAAGILPKAASKRCAKHAKITRRANVSIGKANDARHELIQVVAATPISHVRDWVWDNTRRVKGLAVVVFVVEFFNGMTVGWEFTGGIDRSRDDVPEIISKTLTIVGFGGLLGLICVVAAEALAHTIGHLWAWARGRTVEAQETTTRFAMWVTAVVVAVVALLAYVAWVGNGGARALGMSTESQILDPRTMSALALSLPLAFGVVAGFHYAWPAALAIVARRRHYDELLDAVAAQSSKSEELAEFIEKYDFNRAVLTAAIGDANPAPGELPEGVSVVATEHANTVAFGGHTFSLKLRNTLIELDDAPIVYQTGEAFETRRLRAA